MMRRLNVPAMALAFGVVTGLSILWVAWAAGLFGWYRPYVENLRSAIPGYGPSFFGGIWGGIWGLVDGGIVGGLIAYLYNRFASPAD